MRDVSQVAIPDERWAAIPGWPDYEVSDQGRVRRVTARTCAKVGHILKAVPRHRNGEHPSGRYLFVSLSRDGKIASCAVHRIVAAAFLGPAEGMEVNHRDGVATNKRAANLEYVTRSGNQLHAYRLGLQDARGERNGQAKLKPSDVLQIRALATGERGEKARLARRFGVSDTTIRQILTRQVWPHI